MWHKKVIVPQEHSFATYILNSPRINYESRKRSKNQSSTKMDRFIQMATGDNEENYKQLTIPLKSRIF